MYSLFIARGLPTSKYKMQGIFEFDQAKALSKAGQKVIYLSLDLRSIRRWRKWGISYQELEGVKVYSINLPLAGLPKPLFLKLGSKILYMMYKKIEKKEGRPKLLHAHFSDQAYMASQLKKKVDLPLVVSEHFSRVKDFQQEDYMYDVAKSAYESADKLIVVSEPFKKVISDKFNVDSIYIPNVVDLDTFSYSPKVVSESFNFISVGRLDKLKGMDLLIKAFSEVFKKNENVYLDIYGEGPQKENLEKLIKDLNLQAKVTLWGLRSRNEIAKKMKASQVFVLASFGETFGLAYVEALAMGLPVIATKCGGPESFVNDANGLLVDVDNIDQLVDAMTYMYSNLDNYNNELISEDIKSKFSFDVVASQIIAEYNKLLSK